MKYIYGERVRSINARKRSLAGLFIIAAVMLLSLVPLKYARAAGPAFVQVVAATPQTNQTTVTAKYSKAQVAGDTNIIAVGWNDTTSTISSMTDTKGNTYVQAVPIARGNNESQAIYYAKNIVAAAASGNTVSVTFNKATAFVDLRVSEYSGLDTANPFDQGASASGSSATASTPNVTTTYSNELVFGAGVTSGGFGNAGTGFTRRILTSPDMDMTEDKVVSAIGTYNATASQNGNWVIQVATFKAAGAIPDTQAPTVPANLTATVASPTQINLAWSASTDNVGVTGYKIFRGGTQIATSTGTSYQNTGLTQGTTYSYTVAAYDAAGNTSAQSTAANATTPAPDTQAPTAPTNLSATPISTSEIDLAWTASSDNVGVTGYKVFRNGTQIATTTFTSYQNTGLTQGTTYTYTVAAFDAAGNPSAQSDAAGATTLLPPPDVSPPTVPQSLMATTISFTQINLSWAASTDNVGVTGYKVYRDGAVVATAPSTQYQDTGLTPSTTYQYYVTAVDAAGNESAQSIIVPGTTFTPDTTPPSVPNSVVATATSSTQVAVSWSASSDNAAVTGYKVFRDGSQVANVATASYQDAGLTASTSYAYTVSAYDAAGNESAQSTPANVTTAAVPAFAYPTSVSGRKFLDQNGNPYLLKSMSSWAMGQNLSNAEITSALEGLKADGFNAVTAAPFGVDINNTGDKYKNAAGQPFFTSGSSLSENFNQPNGNLANGWTQPAGMPMAQVISNKASTNNNTNPMGAIKQHSFNGAGDWQIDFDVTSPLTIGHGGATVGLANPDGTGYTVFVGNAVHIARWNNDGTWFNMTNDNRPGPDDGHGHKTNHITFTHTSNGHMQVFCDGQLCSDITDTLRTPGSNLGISLWSTESPSFETTVDNLVLQDHIGTATGAPFASPFGPAWSSMDWLMQEATRLQMTVVFSTFLSYGNTGTNSDFIAAGTTNDYNFGRTLAARYASYPNIIWHVEGDSLWYYGQGPANYVDAMFHGIKDQEGSTHRLVIAEGAQGVSHYDQFIAGEGAGGYQWFKQSADEIYHYASNAVEKFDGVWSETSTYPVVDIEPPYVNAPYYTGNQNQQIRERDYSTFLRGGTGINFGHEKWWPFGDGGIYDGGPGWMDVLNQAPQLEASYTWSFLDSYVSSSSWVPDNGTFLTTGLGSGDTKAASGYSAQAGAVYFPDSRSVTIDTTKITSGNGVLLRWYDPTTGTFTVISSGEPKATSRSVPYPAARADGTSDWVLLVEGTNVTPDSQAPTIPTGLTMTSSTDTQINLSWTTSTDDFAVAGYKVFRNGTQIGTTANPSFTDTNLTANTTYSYTVSAYDASTNESAQSTALVASTQPPDTLAPTTPTNLVVQNVTNSQVTVAWTASTDNIGVTGYKVYRNGTLVGTTANTTYTDTGLTANTSYTYTVAAYDLNSNTSPQSIGVVATTGSVPVSNPAFVQLSYATPQSSQTIVSVAYAQAQTAGNTNIIAIGWNDTTRTINSVTDSKGNTYRLAAPLASGSGIRQAIYYASNIVVAAAGSNTVTVQFNGAASFADLRISEYSGLDPTNPFDKTASATGTASAAATPAVTTTSAKELVYAAGMTTGNFISSASGFTTRVITNPDLDIVFDKNVSTAGSYTANATQGGSWILQAATFKAAGQ